MESNVSVAERSHGLERCNSTAIIVKVSVIEVKIVYLGQIYKTTIS